MFSILIFAAQDKYLSWVRSNSEHSTGSPANISKRRRWLAARKKDLAEGGVFVLRREVNSQ